MNTNIKNAYANEMKYQLKMINNLKRWLRMLYIVSSLSLFLIIYGPSLNALVRPISSIILFISILCILVITLGLKNGKDNLTKVLNKFESI